jgi:hypothetical protein
MYASRLSLIACCVAALTGFTSAVGDQVHQIDATKVVGAQKCGECHKYEVEAWKLTPHFTTFTEMNRHPEAQKIAAAMGIKRIKAESVCLTCHYTVQQTAGIDNVIAGVSCESCHGAARDWIHVHNDKALSEADRLSKSEAAGMIRPDNIYSVASNCYQCHLVPNEKLVNVGGHMAGSANFELVTWSQGMVRHNFLTGSGPGLREIGKQNQVDSPERLRLLFAIGSILDLEYSLRGVAIAQDKATYGITMAQRADRGRKKLAEIQGLAPTDEIGQIVALANGVQLKLNNRAELMAAADQISVLGKKFAASHNGSDLAALDPVIPQPTADKGTPYHP